MLLSSSNNNQDAITGMSRSSSSRVVSQRNRELTVRDRMLSATIGSCCVASLVTPLEVIKVRMQAPHPAICTHRLHNVSKSFVVCDNGIMEHNILCEKFGATTYVECDKPVRKSVYNVARFVFKTDGFPGLYAGLRPTLLMAIPSNVLYFTGYELLRNRDEMQMFGAFAPVFCGSAARILASSCTSPLELLRTRMALTNSSLSKAIIDVRSEKAVISASFRGLFPTLVRDVPFSAIYWSLLEQWTPILRRKLPSLEKDTAQVVASFGAGALAGSVAAFLTQPIDVIKTHHQTSTIHDLGRTAEKTFSSWRTLQDVYHAGGVRGLFAGLQPRMMKVGPACGIMIACYEAVKSQVTGLEL